MTNDARKPIYKKWWFWLIIFIFIMYLLTPKNRSTESTSDTTNGNQNNSNDVAVTSDIQDDSLDVAVEDIDYEEDFDEEDFDEDESDIDQDHSGTPDETAMRLASYGVIFKGDVRNDVTGNWRYAKYSSKESQETIAVDYCKEYFESEDELHALINEKNNTVACIQHFSPDILDVTIHEYTYGEESNAKILFCGDVIAEYFVTISTGEIEELKDEE